MTRLDEVQVAGSTTMIPSKKRLGRGLAALIGDDASEEGFVQDARSLRHLPIEFLNRSDRNPRRVFNEQDIADLSQSIAKRGLLQPLVVRPRGEDSYEIVAGERRWRAAQMAGLHEVPVIIRQLTDAEALEVALIENIQRADLNPIEEAEGYRQLMEGYSYTQQQLADAVGKSRSHIANTLRLLTLPRRVLTMVEQGDLTAGHARALIATDRSEALADRIVSKGLTVRDAEALAREAQDKPAKPSSKRAPAKDADTAALERQLSDHLGLVVEITFQGAKGGAISIRYSDLDQLDDVCRRLTRA
ncbi:ParB family chromosome partitioning protein [Rhodoligotrophos appendicifer]|uniref:ParB/RepB/Spo0J family partition protein n=1 Tax=Rhodoligotrophos appendicifer TaxID=987056 RepID=UPI003D180C68